MYYTYIMCMCTFLADNEALRVLDLSWNHIRKKGAVAVATSLKVCVNTYTFPINAQVFLFIKTHVLTVLHYVLYYIHITETFQVGFYFFTIDSLKLKLNGKSNFHASLHAVIKELQNLILPNFLLEGIFALHQNFIPLSYTVINMVGLF